MEYSRLLFARPLVAMACMLGCTSSADSQQRSTENLPVPVCDQKEKWREHSSVDFGSPSPKGVTVSWQLWPKGEYYMEAAAFSLPTDEPGSIHIVPEASYEFVDVNGDEKIDFILSGLTNATAIVVDSQFRDAAREGLRQTIVHCDDKCIRPALATPYEIGHAQKRFDDQTGAAIKPYNQFRNALEKGGVYTKPWTGYELHYTDPQGTQQSVSVEFSEKDGHVQYLHFGSDRFEGPEFVGAIQEKVDALCLQVKAVRDQVVEQIFSQFVQALTEGSLQQKQVGDEFVFSVDGLEQRVSIFSPNKEGLIRTLAFRCQAKDTDGTIYKHYFQIEDRDKLKPIQGALKERYEKSILP